MLYSEHLKGDYLLIKQETFNPSLVNRDEFEKTLVKIEKAMATLNRMIHDLIVGRPKHRSPSWVVDPCNVKNPFRIFEMIPEQFSWEKDRPMGVTPRKSSFHLHVEYLTSMFLKIAIALFGFQAVEQAVVRFLEDSKAYWINGSEEKGRVEETV
jgi:hypothetical protein